MIRKKPTRKSKPKSARPFRVPHGKVDEVYTGIGAPDTTLEQDRPKFTRKQRVWIDSRLGQEYDRGYTLGLADGRRDGEHTARSKRDMTNFETRVKAIEAATKLASATGQHIQQLYLTLEELRG